MTSGVYGTTFTSAVGPLTSADAPAGLTAEANAQRCEAFASGPFLGNGMSGAFAFMAQQWREIAELQRSHEALKAKVLHMERERAAERGDAR